MKNIKNFTTPLTRTIKSSGGVSSVQCCGTRHTPVIPQPGRHTRQYSKFTRESFDKLAEAASVTKEDKEDTRENIDKDEDEELYPSKQTSDSSEHYPDTKSEEATAGASSAHQMDRYDENWTMDTPEMDEQGSTPAEEFQSTKHHPKVSGRHIDKLMINITAGDVHRARSAVTKDVPTEEIYRRKMKENIKVQEHNKGNVEADFGEEATFHYADKDHY